MQQMLHAAIRAAFFTIALIYTSRLMLRMPEIVPLNPRNA